MTSSGGLHQGGFQRVGMVPEGHFLGAQPEIDLRGQHTAAKPERSRDFAEGIGDHGGVSTVGVDDGDMAEPPRAELTGLCQQQSAQGVL